MERTQQGLDSGMAGKTRVDAILCVSTFGFAAFVHRVALRVADFDSHKAADIAQDAIVYVLEHLREFRGYTREQWDAWLAWRCRAAKVAKKNKELPGIGRHDPLPCGEGCVIGEAKDRGPSPGQRAEAEEDSRRLWEAIHSLPENEQGAFKLYLEMDFNVSAVARALHWPEATTRKRINDAKSKLQQRLKNG